MDAVPTELTKQEFIERFVAEMLRRADADRVEIERYAKDVVETYWEDDDLRPAGPEECAQSDMSYWGE